MCCLRCNTVGEDVVTNRCYAAEAGSPAGPRGGPAGQRRGQVWPGRPALPAVIGRWCPRRGAPAR